MGTRSGTSEKGEQIDDSWAVWMGSSEDLLSMSEDESRRRKRIGGVLRKTPSPYATCKGIYYMYAGRGFSVIEHKL